MRNKIIFLCLAVALVAVPVFADMITLKSGRKIEGEIIESTDEIVRIESYGLELTYSMDEIDKITEGDIIPSEDLVLEPMQAEQDILSIPSTAASPKHRKGLLLATGLTLGLIVLMLLLYVYSALCLQMIAKKTSQEPVWLAWVPIGNLFLMCKIASLSYLWLLGFLLAFLPFVGMFFNLALVAYFYYRIALARNKPGWLGILVCLPIVNLIIMGYLAFSD